MVLISTDVLRKAHTHTGRMSCFVLTLTFCHCFHLLKVSVRTYVCLAVSDFTTMYYSCISCCVRYVGEAFCVYPSCLVQKYFAVFNRMFVECSVTKGLVFLYIFFFLATTSLLATVPAAIYYARSCRSLARQRRHIPILGVPVKG